MRFVKNSILYSRKRTFLGLSREQTTAYEQNANCTKNYKLKKNTKNFCTVLVLEGSYTPGNQKEFS